MASYVAAAMVRTPWGDASTLRERRLSPGRGTPRAVARRNQRERLLGAMVAVASTKGYAATSLADLVEVSGVSSRSFYEHFADKEECFLAAMEEILAIMQQGLRRVVNEGDGVPRLESTVGWLTEALVAQPAAARLLLVESFRAGEAARERINALLESSGQLLQPLLEKRPHQQGMPPELTRALLGGLGGVVYHYLARGEPEAVATLAPELAEWVMSFPAPPAPLRSPGRRNHTPITDSPPFAALVPGERILRRFAAAVAEQGYASTTIAEVATAASISQNTFYSHFRDKEDAFYAALDSSGAQLVAATLPAVRRAPPWPAAMRVALGAVFGFLAAEPAFARLRAVEVYAVGPSAVEQRNSQDGEIVRVLRALATDAPSEVDQVPLTATISAVNSLLYHWVRREGPRRLPELVPTTTYLILAPLLGAEAAHEIACS